MPDLLLPPASPRFSPHAAVAAVLSGAAAALIFGLGLTAGRATAVKPPGPAERCSLPAGIDVAALAPDQRERVVDRAVLCVDHERGALSATGYHAAVAALARRQVAAIAAIAVAAPPPVMMWASSVRSSSSQYGEDDWGARQMLGAPDASPTGADSTRAWASAAADAGIETVELGFAEPRRLSAFEVVESFNPGAITRIEALLDDGRTVLVEQRAAAAAGASSVRHRASFACTERPVIAVRVTLDSAAVSGWNEIDAVGGQPCR
jgi:hypothetical protein